MASEHLENSSYFYLPPLPKNLELKIRPFKISLTKIRLYRIKRTNYLLYFPSDGKRTPGKVSLLLPTSPTQEYRTQDPPLQDKVDAPLDKSRADPPLDLSAVTMNYTVNTKEAIKLVQDMWSSPSPSRGRSESLLFRGKCT